MIEKEEGKGLRGREGRVLKERWKDGKVGRKEIEDEERVLKEGWKDGKVGWKGC